jgi:hypothetical protein
MYPKGQSIASAVYGDGTLLVFPDSATGIGLGEQGVWE